MMQAIRRFIDDRSGAVAVTYALALTALVAIGGVSFDYARMATMDSELQSAADEAALAAATQLDGRAGAITRAQTAVTSYFANSASAVVNRTLLANDGAGTAITGLTFTFYVSFDSATDTFGAVTTVATAAKVVKVGINARKAFYAFTPIVGAFNSGDVTAEAVAGLQAGTCKLPPLMICGPNGGTDFPTAADIGTGIVMKVGPAGQWFPGNFGYVDFGSGSNMVKQLLGTNSASDTCVGGADLTTEPGNKAGATDYLNTRFDIYGSNPSAADCAANGDYCPAKSTRKDLVIQETFTYAEIKNQTAVPAAPARPACGAAAPSGASRTVSNNFMSLPSTALPANTVVGFPRDTCHASGTCGNIGNGTWNVSGYYATHTYLPGGLNHRYDIYKWERDNPGSGLQPGLANTGNTVQWAIKGCKGSPLRCDYTATWTNYCSYPSPIKGTYHATAKDRRVMTVAVTDCTNANGGKKTLPVNKWMDMFLTEPSWDRTSPTTGKTEIYGEIIGVATKPDGSNAYQYYGRQKAVLYQ